MTWATAGRLPLLGPGRDRRGDRRAAGNATDQSAVANPR